MMKHIVKNILTHKERKKLIKDCQPHLLDSEELGRRYPGIKSKAILYLLNRKGEVGGR